MADRSVRVVLSANTAAFESAMKKAEGSAKTLADELGKASQSQGWKQTSTGLVAVGAAALGGAALATKAYADFDAQMSAVKATGDEARGSYDQLREAAIQAGADTKFSAGEAAEGMEALLKAGVSATDVLAGGLSGALDLAAAGELGLGEAAEAASAAMVQFGLDGTQVGHIADVLAAGAGKAQGDVRDMSEALGNSGLVAAQFGLSLEDTVGSLTAFANAGLTGAESGTGFKSMLLQLGNPSKEAVKTMDELGISAYDAQGNFVGMENLAGQLQSTMSGLTQEQRNAAMATIFGSYAIKSANVLYTEGAEGVAKWTAAVNDSGYAAEVAATLQDNLQGDLEKLGGSFETLMIQMGEGTDAPFRQLAQGITGVVDAIGSLDPSTLGSITRGLAAFGGAALIVGGLMKATTAISGYKAAMASLSGEAPRLAGALGGVTKAFAVLGGAFIGAEILTSVSNAFGAQAHGIDEVSNAVARFTAGGGPAALDAIFRDRNDSSKQLVDDVGNMSEGFGFLQKHAEGSNEAIDNLVENVGLPNFNTHVDTVQESFSNLDQTLQGMDSWGASEAFIGIRDASEEAGTPVEKLVDLFPKYAQSVRDAAAASGVAELSADQLASTMEGVNPGLSAGDWEKLQGALNGTAEASAAAGDGIGNIADLFGQQAAAAQGAADATNQVNAAMQESANMALKLSGTESGLEAAYDAATEAAKKNGKTAAEHGAELDRNTEKGRANQSALDGIASAGLAWSDAMQKANAPATEINATMAQARENFVSSAVAMGMSSTAAQELADDYGLVPLQITTQVVLDGAITSQAQVDTLNKRLETIPEEKRADIVLLAQTQGYDVAMAALDKADKAKATPKITPVYDASGVGSATAGMGKVAGLTASPKITAFFNSLGVDQAVRGMDKADGLSAEPGIQSVFDVSGVEQAVRGMNRADGLSANPKIRSLFDGAGVDQAKARISGVQGKTVTITTRHVNIGGGGSVGSWATGGYIRGPGTTTSDSINARLSDREYVLRAAAVERIGVARLDYMNRHGQVPGFADGGYVSTTHATPAAPAPLRPSAGPVTHIHGGVHLEGIEAVQWLQQNLRTADLVS